jgi:hypothetical protein
MYFATLCREQYWLLVCSQLLALLSLHMVEKGAISKLIVRGIGLDLLTAHF